MSMRNKYISKDFTKDDFYWIIDLNPGVNLKFLLPNSFIIFDKLDENCSWDFESKFNLEYKV